MAFEDENEPHEEQERPRREAPNRPGPILHTPRVRSPLTKLIIPVSVLSLLGVAGYFYYRYQKMKSAAPPPSMVNLGQQQPVDTTGMENVPVDSTQPPATQTQTQSQTPAQQQTAPAQQLTPPSGKEQLRETAQPTVKKQMEAPPTKMSKKETKKEKPAVAMREPKVEKKRTVQPVTKTEKPNFSTSSGNYTIFVGSFKIKKNAEDLEQRWKEAGYPTHMTTKGGWYRVSIGNYASKQEGVKEAEKMKDAFENGYWVDPLQ